MACPPQGNISAWKKKEGDSIAPGDVLAEIETDKATMEWEAQEEGFLAKVLMPDGSKDVPVGAAVALIVEEQGDIAAFKDYSAGAQHMPCAFTPVKLNSRRTHMLITAPVLSTMAIQAWDAP